MHEATATLPITEIRINLIQPDHAGPGSAQLIAGASMTIAGVFVVRDIKVIAHGDRFIVAMPQKWKTQKCGRCGRKVDVKHRFCGHCGAPVPAVEPEGLDRRDTFYDYAHPITHDCRVQIEAAVLEALQRKVEEVAHA